MIALELQQFYYTFCLTACVVSRSKQNSGMPGHIGTVCLRPRLDQCLNKDGEVAKQEIERAATVSSVEESIIAANSKRKNGNYNDNNQQNSSRGGRGNNSRGRGTNGGQQQQDRGRRSETDNGRQQQRDQYPSPQKYHDYRRASSMPPRGRSNNSDRDKGRRGPRP